MTQDKIAMCIINPSQYRSVCACLGFASLGFCCATRGVNLVRVLLIKSLNVQEIEKNNEDKADTTEIG